MTVGAPGKWNVAHALEKRQLLFAINCVAALSIFFFGYDQGLEGVQVQILPVLMHRKHGGRHQKCQTLH